MAREINLFRGLLVGNGEMKEEVTHLLFTDDVLIVCDPNKQALLHLRCLLMGSKLCRV